MLLSWKITTILDQHYSIDQHRCFSPCELNNCINCLLSMSTSMNINYYRMLFKFFAHFKSIIIIVHFEVVCTIRCKLDINCDDYVIGYLLYFKYHGYVLRANVHTQS